MKKLIIWIFLLLFLGLNDTKGHCDAIAENYEGSSSRVWGIIGDLSGSEWANSMQFQLSSGITCTAASFELDANNGSPNQNITLEIYTEDGGDKPNSRVDANATVAVTPTASAWNKGTFPGTFSLSASTKYYVVMLSAGDNPTDARYLPMDNASGYTSGGTNRSSTNGSSWEAIQTTNDMNFRIWEETSVSATAPGVSGTGTGPMMIFHYERPVEIKLFKVEKEAA